MDSRERRFSKRYDAAPLQVEMQLKTLLGGWRSPNRAIAIDIAKGGIAVLSPLKFRSGQSVRLSVGNRDHSLRHIPARIVRQSLRDGDFIYGLHFDFEKIPEQARASAEIMLSRLLATLEHSRGGVHATNARTAILDGAVSP